MPSQQANFVENSGPQSPGGSSIITLGYTGERVGEPYIVAIRSHDENYVNNLVVRAILQEDVQIKTSSRWESFGQGTLLGTKAEAVVQAVWKASTCIAWLSRRVWRGTTPIELSLNLKFEAEDDEVEEVVKPTLALQQLVLPGKRSATNLVGYAIRLLSGEVSTENPESVTVVYPPGPSPFSDDIGDIITIKIGNFLEFNKVVIKDIAVSYPPKMTRNGYPISSSVSIQFETYEIVTKDGLDDIYKNISLKRERAPERGLTKEQEAHRAMFPPPRTPGGTPRDLIRETKW